MIRALAHGCEPRATCHTGRPNDVWLLPSVEDSVPSLGVLGEEPAFDLPTRSKVEDADDAGFHVHALAARDIRPAS